MSPDHPPGGKMSIGIDIDNSSVASVTLCSCQCLLALFLVINLNTFKHDPHVNECVENFSDTSSLPKLAEADVSSSSFADGSVLGT